MPDPVITTEPRRYVALDGRTEVEAVQLWHGNEQAVAEWCGGQLRQTDPNDAPWLQLPRGGSPFHGEWVVHCGGGLYDIVPPGVFRTLYRAVSTDA